MNTVKPGYVRPLDLRNGRVDLGDWALLRKNHPTPAALNLSALLAAQAVPEPASVALAVLAALGLWRMRRAARG